MGFSFLTVPLIVFLVVVAPVWIFMHYRSMNRSSQTLNEDDRETIDTMLATIDKLQDRIRSLEALLDADQPGWRGQQTQSHTQQGGE
jgi:phage shock protein B